MKNLCPRCGEELDDFAPCSCALGFGANPMGFAQNPQKPKAFVGGMRAMVERKLKKKAEAAK